MAVPPADACPAEECSVTFIGNATVLLRLGPFTVLTDPNFLHAGQRAYLGYGLWSKRLKEPSIGVDQLPRLDAVVLSHLHGDHWDRVTEAGLDRSVPILTTGQAAKVLGRRGFAAEGLRRWHSVTMTAQDATISVTALPGRHGPGIVDGLLPDVMGSLLDFESAGARRLRVYISGDTLYRDGLAEISAQFPDIDVAILHLGGTKLLGLVTVTMDGRQGRQLTQLLGPRVAVPVHFDDYTVFASPVSDFESEMDRAGLGRIVRRIRRGETATLESAV
jgi:L-ascorbate metabolism protein UlaG (beta-lactamase superfamily)